MISFQPVATLFQQDTGGPVTVEMLSAVGSWLVHESGSVILGNNPWNLHVGPKCPPTANAGVGGLNPSQHLTGPNGLIGNRYVNVSDQNVAIYDNLNGGVSACVANLVSHGSDWAGYDKVLAASRQGNALAFLNALAASAWSAGRYGTSAGGPNVLIPTYEQLLATLVQSDVNPNSDIPVAVCDVASGGTVYSNAAKSSVLITNWGGAKSVGIYANGESLIPIRINLGSSTAPDLRIGWVGSDKVSNISLLHPVPCDCSSEVTAAVAADRTKAYVAWKP